MSEDYAICHCEVNYSSVRVFRGIIYVMFNGCQPFELALVWYTFSYIFGHLPFGTLLDSGIWQMYNGHSSWRYP
jgi:hypothetical protein